MFDMALTLTTSVPLSPSVISARPTVCAGEFSKIIMGLLIGPSVGFPVGGGVGVGVPIAVGAENSEVLPLESVAVAEMNV